MIIYGYIEGDFKPRNGDVLKEFKRKSKNGTTSIYRGIKSDTEINDAAVVIIGGKIAFRRWLVEFETDE